MIVTGFRKFIKRPVWISMTVGSVGALVIAGFPWFALAGTTATATAGALYTAIGLKTHQTQSIDTGLSYFNDATKWYHTMIWACWPWKALDPHNTVLTLLEQSSHNLTMADTAIQRALPGINDLLGHLGFATPHHPDPPLSHAQMAAVLFQQLPTVNRLVNLFYPSLVQWNHWIQKIPMPNWLINQHRWHKFQQESQLLTADLHDIQSILPMIVKMVPAHGTRRYFLIYENTGELRATGGFMTAYSYVTFINGHLQPLHSHNIYNLQSEIRYRPPAPLIIHTYLYSPLWHLRDANTSPNVPTSVQQIYKFYNSIPHAPHLNGVIFVNTWLADAILQNIGGVTMPKTYNSLKVTAGNANYEMEYMAERSPLPIPARKKFIAIMFHEVLHKLAHSPVPVLLATVHSVFRSLNHKDIIFYFNNPQVEEIAQTHNWAGTVDKHVHTDYLEVVDENLGGHKDNFYMHYHVTSRIKKIGSRYLQTTTVTWTNTGIFDNWLVVPYTSWVRFYVPYGSKLISLTGGNAITQDYNNRTLHKTVFGNHLTMPVRLTAQQSPTTASMTATYWLPPGLNMSRYVIQKQPGIKDDHELIIFNGHALPPFKLYTDTTVNLEHVHA
ncbi:MAG: hypothetical protein C7B47_02745 [Sulfobacillus thermosulfidooxidans]|uniref:Uncharacterized protein n=1 Tax=Sulfobacillus thermosulfidooxidans TaxID=28034 RepID=A0A2T2X429_SULTH|nr:MAG: hypothetical protein C7B47_02745 [Sulfobacillus thermosulfidooxidans]